MDQQADSAATIRLVISAERVEDCWCWDALEIIEIQYVVVNLFRFWMLTIQTLFSTIHHKKPPISRLINPEKVKTRYFVYITC